MSFEPFLINKKSLPENWNICRFRDYVYFQEGPGIRNWQYVENDGVRFVNIRCIEAGRLVTDKMSQISKEEAFGKYSHFLLNKGDFIVSSSGTIGRIAVVNNEDLPCCLNTSVIRMRTLREELDQSFLHYFLLSNFYKKQIYAFANGSAQLNYGPSHLEQMEIIIPPIFEQKSIARILRNFDKKIEFNNKQRINLLSVAKAIYKSWFIDFEPFRGELNFEYNKQLKETKSITKKSFEKSDSIRIPPGWFISDLQAIADLNPESWSSKNHPENLEYADLSGVKDGIIEGTTWYKWEDAPSRAKRILKEGDTIVGTVRPGNKSFCLMQRENLTGSTGFAVLRPKNNINKYFIYLVSTSDGNIQRLAHLADGGVYPAIKPEEIIKTKTIIPPVSIQNQFSDLVDPLFKKMKICDLQSKTLFQLRETLLPQLVSGKVRIPDAEKMIEEEGI